MARTWQELDPPNRRPTHSSAGKRLSDEQRRELVKFYQGGATYREVAAQFGVGPSTVSRWLSRAGAWRSSGWKASNRGREVGKPIRWYRRIKRGYVIWHAELKGNGTRKAFEIAEHRLVMEKDLCRPLASWESVHHRNGKRDDNRLENLELWVVRSRNGQRAHEVLCPHCGKPYPWAFGSSGRVAEKGLDSRPQTTPPRPQRLDENSDEVGNDRQQERQK
jgi:DNA-binding transcriptional ArsR family regulator